MRAALVSTILGALLTAPIAAQETPRGVPRDGDTTWIIIHHVAGDKRAQYEQWMSGVWYKTAREVGAKNAAYAAALGARQRLVPTRADGDGTWTYLFVYDRSAQLKTKSGGLRSVFEAAGWPAQKIDAELARMEGVIVRSEGGPMVRQEYPTPK